MRNGIRVGILGLVVAATISPGVAVAADFNVSTTADGDDKECAIDCTLREAIVLAGSADRVLVPSGTYVLTGGELSLNNDTIIGEDARKTVIDGDDKSRVLRVIEVQSRVSNVTIRNGNGVGLDSGAGGGIFIHSGSLLLQNSTLSDNTATTGGGIAAAGTATLIGVTVSGNRASGGRLTRGGGIITSSTGTLQLGNSTVSGNTAVDEVGAASQGGGIYSSGTLAIVASTIANNSAAEGGGLHVVTPPTGAAGSVQNSILAHGTGGACGGDDFNATATVASDATCQLKDPSNLNNVNPQIGALADNGGPTSTHALQPTSPAIGRAASCAALDQRGFARVAPCDSGAYEYRAPTLNVVMQVVNDSGGSFNPSRFTVHVRGAAGGDVSGSPQPGDEKGTLYTLAPGNYAVAADALAGYTLAVSGDCAANGAITLQEGQARTCTITANDIAPTLTVVTQVINDQGGTFTPANFTAHVKTGTIDVVGSPQPGSATGTAYTLSAGPTYTVSADAVTGYTFAITGDCATNGTIALPLGQARTCTITANDVAPTLRVITTVVNNSGGSAVAGSFSAHVRRNGTEVTGSPQAGVGAPGTLYTLTAGTYAVTADGVSGYAPTGSGACNASGSVSLAVGQNLTCTITVDDVAPTLRVITTVVNNSGGSAVASGFSAHVRQNGTEVTGSPQAGVGAPGTLYTLSAGTFAVTADGVSGYLPTGSGACNAAGSVTLALGQNLTCTITVDDVAPTLRVITTVVNNNGGSAVAANFSAHVRQNGAEVTGSPQAGVGTPGTLYTLSAGTYAVTADGVSGYTPTGSGACNAAGSVTLALGQNVTCTITVDDVAPTLRVITTVVNNSGGSAVASSFSAHVRQNGTEVGGSPQAGVGAPGTLYTLTPGTYAVTADGVAGYMPTGSGACNGAGSVTLALGQTLTCTITVDDIPATLRVITEVLNNSGGQAERDDFDAHVKRNGVEVANSPQPGAAAPGTAYTLAAGTYDLSADGEPGYSAGFSAACAGGTITLALNQTATCTITLDDGAGTLNVVTNVVNDDGGTAGADAFDVSVRLAGVDVPTSPQPGSGTGTTYSLPAAAYTVAASGVPGYTYAVTGDCAQDGSITLPLSQARSCTVTANDVAPRLTVVTQVVNDHGGAASPSGFTVHVKRGGTDVSGSPQPGSSGTSYTLTAGSHVVSADAVSGYSSAISGDCAGDGSITLGVGDNRTCTVTANDDPPPVQAQASQQLPPPEPGESVNALPKSGTVKVKVPGSAAYVNLDEAQQLPVGTIVDATKGHVTLVAAADDSGGTATAEFWAGIFKLGQTKGKAPTTILTLVEKLSCPKAGNAIAAAKKKKRRLWGDGSGKFRTKGKHSAATVVGTRWLVEDSCKSTLTRVVRGRVSVRDFVKKKTVIVKAGKKYVAKARG